MIANTRNARKLKGKTVTYDGLEWEVVNWYVASTGGSHYNIDWVEYTLERIAGMIYDRISVSEGSLLRENPGILEADES